MILPFSIRKKKIYIIIHAYIITKKGGFVKKKIEKTGKKAKKSGFLAGKAEKSAVKSSVTKIFSGQDPGSEIKTEKVIF